MRTRFYGMGAAAGGACLRSGRARARSCGGVCRLRGSVGGGWSALRSSPWCSCPLGLCAAAMAQAPGPRSGRRAGANDGCRRRPRAHEGAALEVEGASQCWFGAQLRQMVGAVGPPRGRGGGRCGGPRRRDVFASQPMAAPVFIAMREGARGDRGVVRGGVAVVSGTAAVDGAAREGAS